MINEFGFTRLAVGVVQQAALDAAQAKNAQAAFEARAWLATEAARFYFDVLGVQRSGLWAWMAAGCPKFRKQNLPRR